MKKIIYLLLICFTISYATKIKKITLSQLQAISDLIVLAKVIIKHNKNISYITIKIASFLKGKNPKTLSILLLF